MPISGVNGYAGLFGVTSAAGSKIPRLDAPTSADIAAALPVKNSTAMNGVLNQIMPAPPSLTSPALAPKVESFANITRARAELKGLAAGFDNQATAGSARFRAATSTETITTPGTTTTVTEQVSHDVLLAQGGKLKQNLENMAAGQSLTFEIRSGGQSASITLDRDALAAGNQADVFQNALAAIRSQLDAQGLEVEVEERGGGNAVAFVGAGGAGVSVKGSKATLEKLGVVNPAGTSQHG
ncbi:MAG: hypothetical protein FJZ01_22375 [Candidatus Sericytochromatia bacterium]|nr:hypothetical protein [Candidatus Tanganyikabacteria bacterium]